MANKVTGTTDTSGAISVISNSDRPILLVGVGADTTKEVIFSINGTTDAATHFGTSSPFVEIVKVLIKNGVSNIKGICVGEFGEGKAYATNILAYAAAYNVSLMNESILCIILDCADTTLYPGLKSHLADAEADDMFRYAVVGVPVATTTIDAAKTLVGTISSDRMFIAYPNVVNDAGTIMDGMYTAAGIASIIMTETNDPALPANGVSISGFGGVSVKITNDEMTDLTNSGIVALYPESLVPTIYELVTTAQKVNDKQSIWHDATARLIADNVLSSVEDRLRANYKRTKNVTRILNSIKTDVISILENKNDLEIIQNFDKSTVSVIKDPSDNYGALVDYEFQIVTPLYTITITQHMKV